MGNPHQYSRHRWLKLWRYVKTYGLRRALVKAAGTRRPDGGFFLFGGGNKQRSVSFIGCGQASFATLAYFLASARGQVFFEAYDIERAKAESLTRFYGFARACNTAEELLDNPALEVLYIASNHASHARYALDGLERGVKVFVEKPVCVTWPELIKLEEAASEGKIFAGYNRPYAAAIKKVAGSIRGSSLPLTVACYVHGHAIPKDHWYRDEEEGTRILGNAGHWIDLAVHLLAAVHSELPQQVSISLLSANPAEPDDNFSMAFRTPRGDLFTLHMASRSEPFEGVRETIEIQCGDFSAQIDDFRRLRIWNGSKKRSKRYWPKDVGHRLCTLQPYLPAKEVRAWKEVLCSTRIALHLVDMIRNGSTEATVDLTATPVSASFGAA